MDKIMIFLLVLVSSFIGAFGSLMLKKGSAGFNRNLLSQIKNYKLIFGLSLFGLSSIFYIIAVKFAELSYVYPITSLSYVWISLLSVKFLDEKMNRTKWLGIIFIIVGVFLITR